MARFIVIHSAVPEATQDQIVGSVREMVASLPAGTEWLNSWMVEGEWKIICEWEAPDAEAIQAALAPVRAIVPTETIYEVQRLEPEWYK